MTEDAPRTSVGARRSQATEDAVLDAAAQIILEDGFQKLTMEGVARRARAGKATVYRWWPSRGHLLLALYSRAKSALVAPDTGDLAQDLTGYLRQMLDQMHGTGGREAMGPMVRLLIAEAQIDDTVRVALQAERDERWVHIDRIINQAHARGELNPALSLRDAEQRVISMFWYLLLNNILPPADQAEALTQKIIVGMRA